MSDSQLRVLIAQQAADDIEELYFFTAGRWGAEQAGVYKTRILEALTLLAQNPDMGVRDPRGRSGTRSLRIGSHRIWYRRDGDVLFVTRVLHTSRRSIELPATDPEE